jgi:N-acetylmuramoyl-L-alanine amidase
MFKKSTLYVLSFIVLFFSVSAQAQNHNTLKTIIVDAGHGGPDPGAKGEYSTEAQLTLIFSKLVGKKLEALLPDTKILYTRTDENLPGNLSNKNAANRLRAKIANEAKGDLFVAIHVNSLTARYRKVANGTRQETYYVYKGKGKKKKKVAKTRTVTNYVNVRIPDTKTGTETYIWASGKNDEKKSFIGREDEGQSIEGEADEKYFDSPEAKILASLRTQKYFNNSKLAAEFVEDEFVKYGRPSAGVLQRDWEGIWVLQATAMPSILVETGFICTEKDEAYLNSAKGQDEISDAIVQGILRYKAQLEGRSTTSTSR